MKILTLFFILISASSFAAKNCGEPINATKHQAELFVIELNMDRVELLYFLRKKLNIDGGLQSKTALDEELHSSIMEVLLKSKSKTVMIKRIAEINESFHDFPLQINQAKIEELNTKLAQRLVVGI